MVDNASHAFALVIIQIIDVIKAVNKGVKVLSHIPKIPHLNDSIFAILRLHLEGDQYVAHLVKGLIFVLTSIGGSYEEIT